MPPRLRTEKIGSSLLSVPVSSRPQCLTQNLRTTREFSQTSCRQLTRMRRKMYAWMNGPGANFRSPLPGATNYMGAYDRNGNLIRGRGSAKGADEDAAKEGSEGLEEGEPKEGTESQESMDKLDAEILKQNEQAEEDQRKQAKAEDKLPPETLEDLRPFPLNKNFRSQPVLSEELREAIYRRVAGDGVSVSLASVEFGVSNERVGAVVRLKQMEKEWLAQGKKLATPYSKAVLDMLPKTPYIDPSKPENKGKRPVTHESINDLIVHPATRQQLFVPVAESRHFTRVDAGKAFDNELLPADERIPHPELVLAERELALGLSYHERQALAQERMEKEKARKEKAERKRQEILKSRQVVPGRRWDFVFQDISVESAGRDGRNPKGVGWRYGMPHEDRKKGQVKIPTRVEG